MALSARGFQFTAASLLLEGFVEASRLNFCQVIVIEIELDAIRCVPRESSHFSLTSFNLDETARISLIGHLTGWHEERVVGVSVDGFRVFVLFKTEQLTRL